MNEQSNPAPVTGSIHLAMAAIMRDIDSISKDRKNESQGFKFRSIEDCYNHLHPIFAAHGVTCLPCIEKTDLSDYKNSKGNTVFRSVVTMAYHFTSSDGSSIVARVVGEGMDHGDKATPKALSMAQKYLLFQTFLIPTAQLEDADFYEPTVNPREQLQEKGRKEALSAIIAEKREMALQAATPAEKERLLAEASEMQIDLDNEAGAQLEQRRIDATNAEVQPPAAKKATSTEAKDWRDVVIHIGTKTGPVYGKTVGEIFEKGPLKQAKGLMSSMTKSFMNPLAKTIAGHNEGKHGPPDPEDMALYHALTQAFNHVSERDATESTGGAA